MTGALCDASAGSLELRPVSGPAEAEALADVAVPWILETDPSLVWFYGGVTPATRHVGEMVRRPSSELSLLRCVVLWRGDQPGGLYLAATGREVEETYAADARAMLKRLEREERAGVIGRLGALRGHGAALPPGDFFLSKLVIAKDFRGLGLGRLLLKSYLDAGRARGCTRFSLRVLATNTPAQRLYASEGFAVEGVITHPEPALTMQTMVRDESHPLRTSQP